MAGRPKKPAALLEAEGKSHLSKSELQDRKESELKVPFTDVTPPSYLSKTQKKKFKDIADKLLAIGIMTELDVDCLAMYVLAFDLYVSYTETLADMIETNDLEEMKSVQNLQDKAFRQAHTAARSLCLTITDRCKVTVPPPPSDDDDEL